MIAKRVCVAFLGFDSDRIYLPYEELRCRKLYVIKRKSVDNPNAEYNYGLIKERLKKEVIEEKIVKTDVFLRINCLKEIFEAEKNNHIYINISTGSKLDAIAGMLAAMLFRKIPKHVVTFYAHPDETGRPKAQKSPVKIGPGGTKKVELYSETTGLRDIDEVAILDLEKPENGLLEALNVLSKVKTERKKKLVEALCKSGHIEGYRYVDKYGIVKSDMVEEFKQLDVEKRKRKHDRDLKNALSGALHAGDNRIFRALKKRWKAIEEEERPRNKKIHLTENGKMLVKIFFGDVIQEE